MNYRLWMIFFLVAAAFMIFVGVHDIADGIWPLAVFQFAVAALMLWRAGQSCRGWRRQRRPAWREGKRIP